MTMQPKTEISRMPELQEKTIDILMNKYNIPRTQAYLISLDLLYLFLSSDSAKPNELNGYS